MVRFRKVTCRNQQSPAVVGSGKPFFGWQLESDQRDSWQERYEIRLYHLEQEIWNSGAVQSVECIDVPYEGPALEPGQEYSWQVCVQMRGGDEASSGMQKIFTGIEHWQGKWIEPDPLPQLPENPLKKAMQDWQDFFAAFCRGERTDFLTDTDIQQRQALEPYDPAVRMRGGFTLDAPIKGARLYITAHGIYSIWINGQSVTDTQLNPGFTTYDLRLKYQTYEVSTGLRSGRNEIVIEVADGRYKGKIALGRGCEYGEVLGALFEIHLDREDGKTEVICSDDSFDFTYDGPVRMADLYNGSILSKTILPFFLDMI